MLLKEALNSTEKSFVVSIGSSINQVENSIDVRNSAKQLSASS